MSTHIKVITPTVDTNIYASGDLIGAKNTIAINVASGFKAKLLEVEVVDQAKQSAALDLMFFKADPSNTTFTDNAALDVADADLLTHCGTINIPAANYAALADNSVATVRDVNLGLEANGTSLYMAIISRGTPTFAAATDLQITLTLDVI